MSLMYRPRESDATPEQGDIVVRIPRPAFRLTDPQALVTDEQGLRCAAHDGEITKGLTSPVEYDIIDVVVLSQSCDILRKDQVWLAPLQPLQLQPKDLLKVRKLATGLDPVGQFYLPDLPVREFGRHLALLDQSFSLPCEEFRDYVKRHRLVRLGLTRSAQEYLQYRWSVVFGRLDRDDADWPSIADLTATIADGERKIGTLEKRPNDSELTEEISLHRGYIAEARAHISRVEEHVRSVFGGAPAGLGSGEPTSPPAEPSLPPLAPSAPVPSVLVPAPTSADSAASDLPAAFSNESHPDVPLPDSHRADPHAPLPPPPSEPET